MSLLSCSSLMGAGVVSGGRTELAVDCVVVRGREVVVVTEGEGVVSETMVVIKVVGAEEEGRTALLTESKRKG